MRTPSSMIMGASSSMKLDRPRRLMLCGRPFRSSCIVSIGASWRRTCQALCAPDLSICSAVIRNVPGGCGMLSFCLTACPQPSSEARIDAVTLPDIGDRPAGDVALQIGRQWGVGVKGEAGDPAKNLGVVVLLVPTKNHRPGTGQIFIATGRGAEGFLPDAGVGRIRDAMTPYLAREEYGPGLAYGVDLIAQAFAQEFGVTLSAAPPAPRPARRDVSFPSGATLLWIIFVTVLLLSRLARGRRRWGRGIWWAGGGWGGGGWGGGGGGGGGGGFGGFG